MQHLPWNGFYAKEHSMERRYQVRLKELLDDAVMDRELLKSMLARLETFVEPFAATLRRVEQTDNALAYISGLLSLAERKNAESIAYLHDQERQGLQKFVGQCRWDHRPLLQELVRQVGVALGTPNGVIVFDPSAFVKRGSESVGVQRQWCGRLGKIDNCQVGVYMAYASPMEHALVDVRLYLPQEWASDKARRKKCHVPKEVKFCTRHELALQMLDESGPLLPHGWVTGDDEMGRSSWFRGELRNRNEHYLLAVPSNTSIRLVETTPTPCVGNGRRPVVPFQRVDRWCETLPSTAWTKIEVRDAEKGPLEVEVVAVRVIAKMEQRRVGPEELLFVTRERTATNSFKHDYHLCFAPPDTSLQELARVQKAEHRVEDCLKRAKSEAGLSDYEVRTWQGWHHHQTLSLIATWFLTEETRRGKKMHAGDHRPAGSRLDRLIASSKAEQRSSRTDLPQPNPSSKAQRRSSLLPLQSTQLVGSQAN
jgi:SRSO17 transposase